MVLKMRKKKVFSSLHVAILAAVLILLLIAQSGQGIFGSLLGSSAAKEKTVIILMDALRWDFVLDNLDELPNFRYIVENGAYGKLKPVSPTFTVAQLPAFFSSKKSDKVDWYYAFVFNVSHEWDCSKSFVGELPSPATETDTDILKILSRQGMHTNIINIQKDKTLNKNIVDSILKNNDVIYIYDPNPDHYGHITNLTDERNALSYIKAADSNLGAALETLRRNGLLNKTNLVVLGDHGMAPIYKFPKWRIILEDLKRLGMNEENTCYWNDAGVSIRFWFRNESARKQMEPRIANYFGNSVADSECFFVPDGGYLRSHNVLHPDPIKKRTSLGDLIIGINVGCKLVYENVVPSFLSGFEEKLHEVDAYLSMHGYLDNEHPETLAFIGMTGPAFKRNLYAEMDMVDVAPTLMCGIGYKNKDYYNSIDGKVRCDVLNECRC